MPPPLTDDDPSSAAPSTPSAKSCATSSATSCAASFTCPSLICSSFTCHIRESVAWVPPLADEHLHAPVLCGAQHVFRHVLRQVLHVRPSRVTYVREGVGHACVAKDCDDQKPSTSSAPSSAAPGFRRLIMTRATINTFSSIWRGRWWRWLCVVEGFLFKHTPPAPFTPSTKGKRAGQHACRKRPSSVRAYAPTCYSKPHPRAPPPDPRLNWGPCSSLPGLQQHPEAASDLTINQE